MTREISAPAGTAASVARGFAILGIAAGFLGGFQALFLRVHQAWGDLSTGKYIYWMSIHGTWMELFLGPALLLAVPGCLVIPRAAGRTELRVPWLQKVSLALFLAGGLALLAGVSHSLGFVRIGAPVDPVAAAARSLRFWIVAACFVQTSMALLALNFLATLGFRIFRANESLAVSALAASSLLLVVTGPFLALRGLYLVLPGGLEELDRNSWGVLQPYFGQLFECALLLPALAIAAEALERWRAKLLPARRYAHLVFLGTVTAVFAIWFFNQLRAEFGPVAQYVRSTSELITRVFFAPLLFLGIGAMARLFGGGARSTSALFATACYAELLVGGISGILLAFVGAFGRFHGTEFTVAHFHFMLGPIVLFAGMAGFYELFPKLSGCSIDESLGRRHFWGTVLFFHGVFVPLFLVGLLSGEKRQAVWQGGSPVFAGWRLCATVSLVGLVFAQGPLLWNLFRSKRVS